MDLRTTCDVLVERNRQRQQLRRTEQALTRQIRSLCRRILGGDKVEARLLYNAVIGRGSHPLMVKTALIVEPFLVARSTISGSLKETEIAMAALAKTLPVWPRVQATQGFGALGLASIVGETGDLNKYGSHSKLWRRLGLAVVGGHTQRKVRGLDPAIQGYNPTRRAVVWNVGRCILQAHSRVRQPDGSIGTGSFRIGYDERKAYELARGLAKGHAHRRAKRYMEKRLIRNIWRAWREAA